MPGCLTGESEAISFRSGEGDTLLLAEIRGLLDGDWRMWVSLSAKSSGEEDDPVCLPLGECEREPTDEDVSEIKRSDIDPICGAPFG